MTPWQILNTIRYRGPRVGTAQFFSRGGGDATVVSTRVIQGVPGQTGWEPAFISNALNAQDYNITDKRYFEVVVSGSLGSIVLGTMSRANYVAFTSNPYTAGISCLIASTIATNIYSQNGATSGPAAPSVLVNDIVGLAIDGTTGAMYYSINGVWQSGQNPSGGTGALISLPVANSTPFVAFYASGDGPSRSYTAKLDPGELVYALPTGYAAWNTV